MQEVTGNIRVRFAPSPTGFLHVGGARTAIFNWLFARRNNGKFLLRIEDTDIQRSRSHLTTQIIEDLNWLGLESDEPVVYQAARAELHRNAVFELINKNHAYYAFETPEELQRMRAECDAKKIPFRYKEHSSKPDQATVERYLAEGKPYVIRFSVPDGVTEFDDMVHGRTIFNNSEIDDFVILRSDGTPVYQLAVVVDDHDMGITHIIRGDDHLANTPKQILLYKALGWEIPVFAHLPMIMDENRKKLSKRNNTVAVGDYRKSGYLPEAMFNFLTLLGYAPENKKEIISKEELIREFSFGRVNKKSAIFDLKKLKWINSEYIKKTDSTVLLKLLREFLIQNKTEHSDFDTDYLLSVINLMKGRVSTINEFYEFGRYFFTDPVQYNEKMLNKHMNERIRPVFARYLETLPDMEWKAENIEKLTREFCSAENVKPAEIIHLLRLSLTGISVSPGIFELMETLGNNTVIRRIKSFLSLY